MRTRDGMKTASSSTRPAHPTALALHEYHLALLPREDADGIARHLGGCERCQTELDALAADQGRFEREVFPLTREAMERRGTAPRWGLRWGLPSLLVLTAGTCLVLLVSGRQLAGVGAGGEGGADDILRAKGQGLLAVFASRAGSVISIEDGKTAVRAGDRIRFVLWPAGLTHAVIASVDGAGRVTVYHPYGGSESAPLAPGPRVEVPGSIELDDSPGPERVFAVLSARPLQTAVVVEALKKLALEGSAAVRRTDRLSIGLKATQQSILLEKLP